MMRMTKITSNENYQRYHIAFSHAIGFTVAVDGIYFFQKCKCFFQVF